MIILPCICHILCIYPPGNIQTSAGDHPSNTAECQAPHHQPVKTYFQLFLATLTDSGQWTSLPSGWELCPMSVRVAWNCGKHRLCWPVVWRLSQSIFLKGGILRFYSFNITPKPGVYFIVYPLSVKQNNFWWDLRGNHYHNYALNDILSVLGLNLGYTVKYRPWPCIPCFILILIQSQSTSGADLSWRKSLTITERRRQS